MVILPSVFTEQRLKEIQQTTDDLNFTSERLRIVKQQRVSLEVLLPSIEFYDNWRLAYEQVESLLKQERALSNEYKSLWGKISTTLSFEEPVSTGWRILQ